MTLILRTFIAVLISFLCVANAFQRQRFSSAKIQSSNHQTKSLLCMKVLPNPLGLKNKYFGLRHGQSTANVAGIISSTMLVGTTNHGLTELGRAQSRESAPALLKLIGEDQLHKTIFYSSLFKRAKETTEESMSALHDLLQSQGMPIPRFSYLVSPLLRERNFGEYDGGELGLYNNVWTKDVHDADNSANGVESVNTVIKRLDVFLRDMEKKHQNANIVVTSHADTLQIMQVYMCGADVRQFSSYRFKNAEVRNMLDLPPPDDVRSG